MTSSWSLHKRHQHDDTWNIDNFSLQSSPLGGWEDHYIINSAHRECRPGFLTMPIGNKYGFAICKRQQHNTQPSSYIPEGYHKFRSDLYSPYDVLPIQISNPYYYYDRKIPNEEYYHLNDYIARDINYNGTGIDYVYTPMNNRKAREYGFSYTSNPPYRYDVTRLHQVSDVWNDIRERHGQHPITSNTSITSSTF